VGGDAHLQRLRAERQKLIEADEANSFAQLQMIEEKQALLRAEQQEEQMAMQLAPDQTRAFLFDPLGLATMIEEKQALLRAEQQQERMNRAPDQTRELLFDPLGLARRNASPAVCALFASAFPTPSSAEAADWALPYSMPQDQKDLEELVFLTVVALLVSLSGESMVFLSQVWPGLHRRDTQVAPVGEVSQSPFPYQLKSRFYPVDGQCYPVDMECDYCEMSEEFSSYYGEEVWLCRND
jgi:hypothetical protein